jgi:hypothetical protein
VLGELGSLLHEVAETLVVLACGADAEGLYWRCIDGVDSGAECQDLVAELLRTVRRESGAPGPAPTADGDVDGAPSFDDELPPDAPGDSAAAGLADPAPDDPAPPDVPGDDAPGEDAPWDEPATVGGRPAGRSVVRLPVLAVRLAPPVGGCDAPAPQTGPAPLARPGVSVVPVVPVAAAGPVMAGASAGAPVGGSSVAVGPVGAPDERWCQR